jgi:2-oxo-4-hydroxy-4-carboxy--5-ureidoimidazoline (OHCU) decarboxylase
MKINLFEYEKNPGEISSRKILVLNSNEYYIEGIDLNNLNEEEQNTLTNIQKEYEEKIKPFFFSSYRKFAKDKIVENTFKDALKMESNSLRVD